MSLSILIYRESESRELANFARVSAEIFNRSEEETAAMRATRGTTDRYDKQKEGTVSRFISILRSHPHPKISALGECVFDEQSNDDLPKLIILCRHKSDNDTKVILNACIIIFLLNLNTLNKEGVMVDITGMTAEQLAKVQYRPGTLSTTLKQLFAWLHSVGIHFKQAAFKDMTGSYHAIMKDKFQTTLELRPDYGDRKSAPIDMDW